MMRDKPTHADCAQHRPPSFRYAATLAPHAHSGVVPVATARAPPRSITAAVLQSCIGSAWLKRSSDSTLSNAMTRVIVGDSEERFVTHFDLLSFWSPRLRDLLKFDRTMLDLPDVNPKIFRIFLDWMRTDGHCLPQWDAHAKKEVFNEPLEVNDDEVLEDAEAYYSKQPEAEALDCYAFAHKYEIRLLKNDLFDCIHAMNPDATLLPSYSVVLQVWNHFPSDSPLRQYLIDIYARNWSDTSDIGYREELILRKQLPGTFWVPVLLQREQGFLDDYAPWEEDLCRYHDHDRQERKECYWQHINGGNGYVSDEDSDEKMEDEYDLEDPLIDDGCSEQPEEDMSDESSGSEGASSSATI